MALSADGLPQQSSPSDVLESGPLDIKQLAVIFDRLGAEPEDAQLVLAALRSTGHERFTVADVLRFLTKRPEGMAGPWDVTDDMKKRQMEKPEQWTMTAKQ